MHDIKDLRLDVSIEKGVPEASYYTATVMNTTAIARSPIKAYAFVLRKYAEEKLENLRK